MADILGIGLTHYPLLLGRDEYMAALLKTSMKDPDIPTDVKDPANWSELGKREWSDDGGTAAADRATAGCGSADCSAGRRG